MGIFWAVIHINDIIPCPRRIVRCIQLGCLFQVNNYHIYDHILKKKQIREKTPYIKRQCYMHYSFITPYIKRQCYMYYSFILNTTNIFMNKKTKVVVVKITDYWFLTTCSWSILKEQHVEINTKIHFHI